MSGRLQKSGTEIDPDELRLGLEASNLKGMVAPIQLIIELYGIKTYEELFPVLQQRNQCGHFQVETTDVATFPPYPREQPP